MTQNKTATEIVMTAREVDARHGRLVKGLHQEWFGPLVDAMFRCIQKLWRDEAIDEDRMTDDGCQNESQTTKGPL